MIRGEDGEMREVEVVSTRDKEGVFQAACPVMHMLPAVLCAILNTIPGAVYSTISYSSKTDISGSAKTLTGVCRSMA